MYRVHRAEYDIHILVAASQEYVNTYSTRRTNSMLGGWVNPHRERQTIPQGQTSSPPKSFLTPAAKAHPNQTANATAAETSGTTHRARSRSPFSHFGRYNHFSWVFCRDGGNTFTPERYRLELNSAHTFTGRQAPSDPHTVSGVFAAAAIRKLIHTILT